MNANEIEADTELRQVLSACYQFCSSRPADNPNPWSFCYTWVLPTYRKRFGRSFHQGKLRTLANLGLLEKEEAARGGSRRYYRISDPAKVASLLSGLG